MIVIVDYGAGNLRSVKKAFDYTGVKNRIISKADEFKNVDKVVLPGVGAFGAAIKQLESSGFVPVLKDYLSDNGVILGICLGMQLLMESSEESDSEQDSGYLKEHVKDFPMARFPR